MIHADYLSDLYTDTCSDNTESDTNIDFGLLTTIDIDPYQSDDCSTHKEL